MPINNRDLTPDEFAELDEINERLRSDVLSHAPASVESESPLVDISHYYYSFDLDAMRVLDKLLAANDYGTQSIMITLMFLHGQDIIGSTEWITVNHLNAYMSVHYAIMSHEAENGGRFDTENNRRVCRLLFPDCSNAEFIESLIRDRGITDAYEIRRAVDEIPRTHSAVQGGAL